jgi:hypothetical protein
MFLRLEASTSDVYKSPITAVPALFCDKRPCVSGPLCQTVGPAKCLSHSPSAVKGYLLHSPPCLVVGYQHQDCRCEVDHRGTGASSCCKKLLRLQRRLYRCPDRWPGPAQGCRKRALLAAYHSIDYSIVVKIFLTAACGACRAWKQRWFAAKWAWRSALREGWPVRVANGGPFCP